MKGNVKRIATMYEGYLRKRLMLHDKETVIEEFVQTIMSLMDFNNPQVYAEAVKTMLREEKNERISKAEGKEKAQAEVGEPLPEPEPREDLDLTNMLKPNGFDDLMNKIKTLSSSNQIALNDLFNATSIAKSLKSAMFDVEVPQVGILRGALTFMWAGKGESAVIVFEDELIIYGYADGKKPVELKLGDNCALEAEQCMKLVREVYELLY